MDLNTDKNTGLIEETLILILPIVTTSQPNLSNQPKKIKYIFHQQNRIVQIFFPKQNQIEIVLLKYPN